MLPSCYTSDFGRPRRRRLALIFSLLLLAFGRFGGDPLRRVRLPDGRSRLRREELLPVRRQALHLPQTGGDLGLGDRSRHAQLPQRGPVEAWVEVGGLPQRGRRAALPRRRQPVRRVGPRQRLGQRQRRRTDHRRRRHPHRFGARSSTRLGLHVLVMSRAGPASGFMWFRIALAARCCIWIVHSTFWLAYKHITSCLPECPLKFKQRRRDRIEWNN